MTKKITTLDEAEYILGKTFSATQEIYILNYIQNGIIPALDGCQGCDRAYVRRIIAEIRDANTELATGVREWPWPEPPVEIPDAEIVSLILDAAENGEPLPDIVTGTTAEDQPRRATRSKRKGGSE